MPGTFRRLYNVFSRHFVLVNSWQVPSVAPYEPRITRIAGVFWLFSLVHLPSKPNLIQALLEY